MTSKKLSKLEPIAGKRSHLANSECFSKDSIFTTTKPSQLSTASMFLRPTLNRLPQHTASVFHFRELNLYRDELILNPLKMKLNWVRVGFIFKCFTNQTLATKYCKPSFSAHLSTKSKLNKQHIFLVWAKCICDSALTTNRAGLHVNQKFPHLQNTKMTHNNRVNFWIVNHIHSKIRHI